RNSGSQLIKGIDFSGVSTNDWLIVYATRSGNAKMIATFLQVQFKRLGLNVRCRNISSLTSGQLKTTKYLFVVISTDGNGVPPSSAKSLFKQLETLKFKFTDLNYSICALGDSSYEAFCQAGKELDSLLKNNNAQSMLQRVDCDADFSERSTAWVTHSIQTVLQKEGLKLPDEFKPEVEVVKQKFKSLQVKEVVKLSKGDAEKSYYHIVLSSVEDLRYIKPGDSIEIFPKNPEWIIDAIFEVLKLHQNEKNRGWLIDECEITSLNKTTVEKYNGITKNHQLKQLLNDNKELRRYLAKANFHDLIVDYPGNLNANQLKEILPAKKGRLYSVASSSEAYRNELHITVKTIRFTFQRRKHEGAGSVELTANLKPGETIQFKHHPGIEFRLPEHEHAPIILIGIGTGIAPFRAFLQETQHEKSDRDIWLIWGGKYKATDFIYESELTNYQKSHILNKLDVIFSRDGSEKKYVQDLVKQNETRIVTWANKGAHFYVCGSLQMAEGVVSTITSILNSTTASKINFQELLRQGRYHEDAY
ncbi:MAG: flavodoxin domain-containing protein, partial [Draconibacterium sp.]